MLPRGRSASASGWLSAEGAADSIGVSFESVGGGEEPTGGDGGASRDDGGGTSVVEPEEEDSVFLERALGPLPPFLRGSACAEETESNATNEMRPMNFRDMKKGTLLCVGPAREPLLENASARSEVSGVAPPANTALAKHFGHAALLVRFAGVLQITRPADSMAS